MARKRTFDHGLRVVRPGETGYDRLTGSYSIVTLDDTATPYGQQLQPRYTPQDTGTSRVNVAPKRTFDHEGVIRHATLLIYVIGIVFALAILVGTLYHDTPTLPSDPGTPSTVTTAPQPSTDGP